MSNGGEKTKIGLLGCGLISQFSHLPALKKAEGVELTAVCDLATDLAERIANQYGIPHCFGDLDSFLNGGDFDAVLIATADQDHVSNSIQCLRHGKHVLLEKPAAITIEDCAKLAAVVEEGRYKLQMGNMKRYDPGIQFAQAFISTHMGPRLSVSGWYCDTEARPLMQASLRLPLIRSERQRGFDPSFKNNKRVYKLTTHGSHLVNTLRFFGGEISAVHATLSTKNGNYSWHGILRFADGAAGHFELTTAIKMDWLEGFRVHGEGGSVEVRSFLPFTGRASEVRVFDSGSGEYRSPITPDSDPYERQVEAFARAVRGDQPVTPDIHDGMADLKILHAIIESVNTDRWVEIEPQPAVATR